MSKYQADTCTGREELVHRFLDDELTRPEHEAFLSHLQSCQSCQALLGEMQALFIELDALEDIVAPPNIVPQVMNNLPASGPSPWPLEPGWLALSAQIIIGLVLIVLAWPMLSLTFVNWQAWQPRLSLSTRMTSLAAWSTDLITNLGRQAQAWWASGWVLLPDFNISPSLGLVLISLLALAWLIGNGLLLRQKPFLFKNGGTS